MKPQDQTDSEKLNNDPIAEGAEETVIDGQESAAVSGTENIPQPDVEVTENTDVNTDADDALEHFGTRTVAPPKKRKFGWVGYVALLIVIGLSVWMMLKIVMADADEFISFGEVFAAGDWRFGVISLAVLIVIIACICFEYVVVIKATTNKFALGTGIKVALLGKFYDNVTPLASGGQPMQIYYLHKKGYSGGTSTAVVFIKYFVWMISWLLVSILLMACNTGVLDVIDSTLRTIILVCGWVGLGVNMILPLTVIMFVVMPKLTRKLASVIVGAGHKIKIVKDKEATLNKAYNIVNDFRSSFAIMSRRPVLFIVLVLLCLVEVMLNYMLPYFIMRAFSGITSNEVSVLFAVASLNTYVTLAVSIIPTPGNTGAMEGIGALAFSVFVTGSVQFWSMLTWRTGIYYIYIIIGLGITVFEFIRKIVRRAKQKKKEKTHNETEP